MLVSSLPTCRLLTVFPLLLSIQGQDLVIGNVGDSRAILGTRDKDNDLVALQLTVDLKPNLPSMLPYTPIFALHLVCNYSFI